MDEPKITSAVRGKNPKRVEQGKRLGAISKAAKEKKRLQRLVADRDEEENWSEQEETSTFPIGLLFVVGVTAVIVMGVYFKGDLVKKVSDDPTTTTTRGQDTETFGR